MRIDLTDTTFIIPVRIDSMIRLENLLMSVDSIVRYFRTRILILEASSYQNEISSWIKILYSTRPNT